MLKKRLILFGLVAVLVAVGSLTSGCSGAAGQANESHSWAMAPLHTLPADVQSAPAPVREAYQFAVANPEVLQALPCYCGCGVMGHASNYACYVAEVAPDGAITYDPHALGCSICVDITLDAMRLLKQGKSVPEIRTYVDSTYAQYGPSNMP